MDGLNETPLGAIPADAATMTSGDPEPQAAAAPAVAEDIQALNAAIDAGHLDEAAEMAAESLPAIGAEFSMAKLPAAEDSLAFSLPPHDAGQERQAEAAATAWPPAVAQAVRELGELSTAEDIRVGVILERLHSGTYSEEGAIKLIQEVATLRQQ